jgi:hypothetical protein
VLLFAACFSLHAIEDQLSWLTKIKTFSCYELGVVLNGDFSALLHESSEWYLQICFVVL